MTNTRMDSPLSTRKQNIAQHFTNADNYNHYATVQANICDILVSKINQPHQNAVLEIGAGQGQLTQKLSQQITADSWHINELCAEHKNRLQTILPQAHIHIADAEHLNPILSRLTKNSPIANQQTTSKKELFSLIISASAVQWFDQPLGFIAQSAEALQTGGQLLFNTFTPNNFKQIRQLTGKGLDYPTIEQWENQLIRHNFEIIEISTHLYELEFDSPLAVLKHVKQTGVSVNTDKSFQWTKSSLVKFIEDYQRLFSVNNENNENQNAKNQNTATQDTTSQNAESKTNKVILSYEALVVNAVKG